MRRSSLQHGIFTAEFFEHDPATGLMLPAPYRAISRRNNFVNDGGGVLLSLVIGAGGTPFDNTHAFFGVGDSNTATDVTMTDLQAALAATVNIASSTNASPIVLTTTGAHGYSAGDTITVDGHLVNTAANGTWVVTVPSGSSIGLVGSAGSGIGAATGTTAKGNRFRAPMDATFPSIAGNILTWKGVFGPGQAEWGTGIKEGAIFNAFHGGNMLARMTGDLGIKTPGTTLRLNYRIHCP